MEKKSINPNVDLSSVLEALVDSIASAQRAADIATIEQFIEVGLTRVDEDLTEIRTLDVLSLKTDEKGDTFKSVLKIPLVSVAPPSHLRIKTAEVSLNFRANVLEPSHANGRMKKELLKEPVSIKGYVVRQELAQDQQTSAAKPALGDVSIKLVIDSPPISDLLGNLIEQIGNSRSERLD